MPDSVPDLHGHFHLTTALVSQLHLSRDHIAGNATSCHRAIEMPLTRCKYSDLIVPALGPFR